MTATISGYAFNAAGRPRAATVTAEAIFEAGAGVQPIGFLPAEDALIVSSVSVTADPTTGAWSVELEPNAEMEPPSSYYRFTIDVDGVTRSPVFAVVSGDSALHDIATATAPFVPDVSSSGRLVAYTRILTDWTTSTTSFADVTGAALAVTVGTRPLEVEFYCSAVVTNTASKSLNALLMEVGGAVLASGGVQLPVTGGAPQALVLKHVFDVAPSPGLHTYKVQAAMGEATGTRTIQATQGFTFPVCYLKAVEN